LAAARAVITIWTENSVKSDWVRAEAGRAKAEGKLIPVKTTDVAYADIPLPFGEMHTENVGSTDLIRAAIVAQLTKPTVTPSPLWQITSTFKYQVLTWIGIVGSAITLFANLNGVLNFADWARELVKHWHEWNQIVWGWAFRLIKVEVPKEVVPLFSFTAFTVMLVIGVNLSFRINQKVVNSQLGTTVGRKLRLFGVGVILYLAGVLFVAVQKLMPFDWDVGWKVVLIEIVIWGIGFPIGYLLVVIKERAIGLIDSILFACVAVPLLFAPLVADRDAVSELSQLAGVAAVFILFQICWMAVISFSPLQQLTRRLVFVVLGVLVLIGLNEISELNLHQYLQPPRCRTIRCARELALKAPKGPSPATTAVIVGPLGPMAGMLAQF
jgi:hypothetical protein